jgi:hypothetical protein
VKPFECQGYWWIPGQESLACPGTLRGDESGELRLRLLGVIITPPAEKSSGYDVPTVCGEVVDSDGLENTLPRSTRVTLRNCFETQHHFGSGGRSTQELFAHRALFGSDLIADHDSPFSSVDLSFSGLASWADDLSGFSDARLGQFSLAWEHPKPLTEATFQGGRLLFGVGCATFGGGRERRWTESVGVNVWLESPIPESVLEQDVVYPLQNFLTFATDHPNALTKLQIRAREAHALDWITVLGPRTFDDESVSADLLRFKMLFTLADVRSRLEQVFRRWWDVSKRYAAALNLYFGLQYRPPEYSDFRFQLTVQVLALYYHTTVGAGTDVSPPEPFDVTAIAYPSGLPETTRVLLDSHPLVMAERALVALTERHEEAFGPLIANDSGTGRERFIAAVTETLRYVLTRKASSTGKTPSGTDYYWRCEQVAFLWKICLLHELGFSVAEQTTLLSRNAKYIHLRDKIRPSLA